MYEKIIWLDKNIFHWRVETGLKGHELWKLSAFLSTGAINLSQLRTTYRMPTQTIIL